MMGPKGAFLCRQHGLVGGVILALFTNVNEQLGESAQTHLQVSFGHHSLRPMSSQLPIWLPGVKA